MLKAEPSVPRPLGYPTPRLLGADEMERRTGNKQKHESRNPLQRALINRFHRNAVAMVERVQPDTILDLGCGEGYAIAALQQAGVQAKFSGIDFSDAALREARGRLGDEVELKCADLLDLQHTDEKYELVMMLEVLEHIIEPERMIEVFNRLCSGHLLLSVPREPFFRGLNLARGKNIRRWGNDPEHVNHWSRRSFIRWVDQYFDVVESPGVFPWTMVLARLRTRDT